MTDQSVSAEAVLGDGVRWARAIAAAASLGAAAVHAAAIPVHFDHGTRYGAAFVCMAWFGTLAAGAPFTSWWRAGLRAVLVVNAAIVALWFVAVNWGVPGDEKEAIGVASAVATMLEVGAITAAALGLAFARRLGRAGADAVAASAPGWRAPLAACGVVALLATPGVATAADHEHGAGAHAEDAAHVDDAAHASGATGTSGASGHDHPNQEYGVSDTVAASTLTGIYSWMPTAVHSGGSGNASHDASDGSPCAPSDDQVAAADALVAASTLALPRYRDPAVAVAAGYRPLGWEPNGVYHYLNEQYIRDGVLLDPAKPEAILYGRTNDGALYPVGVMYMTGTVLERGPRIGGCLTPWHRHGFPFARPGETSQEMMHVWTVPVPGGPYAEHVEGEYARIYLNRAPVNTDVGDPTATDGVTSTTVPFESLTSSFGLVAGGGIDVRTVLNAINVHREAFCADPLRAAIAARVKDQAIIDRMCDPVMNGLLPGASAPSLDTVLSYLRRAANGTTPASPSTTR